MSHSGYNQKTKSILKDLLKDYKPSTIDNITLKKH